MIERQGYDLVLIDEEAGTRVPLMFARQGRTDPRATVRGEVGQRTEQESLRALEVPRVWQSWHAGAGYSRYLADDTYEECEFGEASYPLVFTPSGFLQHVTLPSTTTSDPRFFFELPSTVGSQNDLYMGAGRYVWKIPLGTGTPVVDADFGAGRVCDSAAVANSTAYVSLFSSFMWKKVSGGGWAQSANVARGRLGMVNWTIRGSGTVLNRWRLIGTVTSNSFAHVDINSDPMVDANWTTITTIGDSTYPIQSIAVFAHVVVFIKQNGVFFVDERGYSPAINSWQETVDANNGLVALGHPDGHCYASHHQGLTRTWVGDGRTRQSDPGWVHFGSNLPYEGQIKGRCTALALNAGKLVAAFWNANSNTSYICELHQQGDALVWHGAKCVIEGKVTALHVNALQSYPRLHIGWVDRSGNARYSYQWLPKASSPYADWLDDNSGFYFAPTCRLFLPRDPWTAPTGRKRIWAWELETENLVSGNRWSVYANADAGAYELQGAAVVSPYADLPVADNAVTGRAIGVRLDGFGGLTLDGSPVISSPPVLRALRGTAEVDVKLGRYLEYTCVLGEGQETRYDAANRLDPEIVTEQLVSMQERDAIVAVDRDRWLSVWMLPGLTWEDEQTGSDGWRRTIRFRVRVLGQAITYGSGVRYGSGAVYAGTTGG